jgi:lipoyl(octanoyl) transferase
MEKQEVIFQDLGIQDYQSVWNYQEELLQQNVRKKSLVYSAEPEAGSLQLTTPGSSLTTHHYLLFVEHTPVYTLGKSGKMENLLITEEERAVQQIDFYKTNRGGDITFHGLQQIVGYPIMDLEKFTTDIGKYLRNIEETIILTLEDYGISAGRSPGETGVWIDPDIKGRERKICAIGVRCSRWVTMHGFAFNVNTDLSYFDNIVPCGIEDKKVTSLEKELGRRIDLEEAKSMVKKNFEKVFNVHLVNNRQNSL